VRESEDDVKQITVKLVTMVKLRLLVLENGNLNDFFRTLMHTDV
jgi:hypothetical protein